MEAAPDTSAHDWGALPADLLNLVFRNLTNLLGGGISVYEARCTWTAVSSQCTAWRAAAQAELSFHIRLDPSAVPQLAPALAALPIAQITLPPVTASSAQGSADWTFGFDASAAARAADLLGKISTLSPAKLRSAAPLAALHGVPAHALTVRGLSGWTARGLGAWTSLRGLTLAPVLPSGGGADMLPFAPGAFPPSLLELDMPVPRHPFRLAAGLPCTLERLTLRCEQDFILTRWALGGGADAEGLPAAGSLPRSWRQLAVHAGRTAGLDLDDLRLLPPPPTPSLKLTPSSSSSSSSSSTGQAAGRPKAAGSGGESARNSQSGRGSASGAAAAASCSTGTATPSGRSLALVAPQVMLSTSDPACPGLLAAPPIRSLEATVGQHLAALAPVLAAAGLQRLRLVAGEASFYCRRPGRLGILDVGALPPAGRVQPAGTVEGYAATLAWPAAAPAGPADAGAAQGPVPCHAHTPYFELCFARLD